jgi:hypothetical protein
VNKVILHTRAKMEPTISEIDLARKSRKRNGEIGNVNGQ